MKRSFLDTVLRGAEALAARDPVGTLPDPELLRRFAASRDPGDFAVLVRRHGPLVWGVCRNLLPADADAEDAFQATFLALVRSTASIRKGEALGGWLHGVAYRVALKARRAAARRRKREVAAAVPEPSSPVPDAAWDELQAAVHEEVCKLPDRLRLPFVLCGLQGRPQKEAAAILGWQAASVSGRLSEARRVLLARLARRGVPAALAAGAAVLCRASGHAAVPRAIRLKVLAAAESPTAVPSNIQSLAHGVTPMYLTRTKLLAAGLMLVGVLTTSAGLLSRADAQAPKATGYDEAIRAYYDALRVRPAPKDKWEYKFLPVDRPLTTGELQKVLSGADQEGWSYCGSQDLAQEKTGKVTAHMVFKRAAAGGGVAGDAPDAKANTAAALLAELSAKEAAARQRAEAELQLRRAEVERALKLADDKAATEAARAADAAAEQRLHAESALKEAARAKAAEIDRAAAEKAKVQELEEMKAKYEALIRELQAELKAKKSEPPTRPGPAKK